MKIMSCRLQPSKLISMMFFLVSKLAVQRIGVGSLIGNGSVLRFSTAAALTTNTPIPLKFKIRPATIEDIPAMDSCNRANLPENYDSYFYESQLAAFRRLSFIAETDDKEMVRNS